MPLRDSKIRFGLLHVGATPHPDELATTLQALEVVMVIAQIQEGTSQPDVFHGQEPQRIKGAQRNLVAPNLWITSSSRGSGEWQCPAD